MAHVVTVRPVDDPEVFVFEFKTAVDAQQFVSQVEAAMSPEDRPDFEVHETRPLTFAEAVAAFNEDVLGVAPGDDR